MPFLFNNYSLKTVIYLLIRCYNFCSTEIDAVRLDTIRLGCSKNTALSKQNTQTHTHTHTHTHTLNTKHSDCQRKITLETAS